jgi:hypothetical protein
MKAIAALVLLLACGNHEDKSGTPAGSSSGVATMAAAPPPISLRDATPVGSVEATTLTADFDNEVRVSQMYAGKIYGIRGDLVYAQDHGDQGLGPHLVLKGAKYVDVACQVETSELPALAKLEPRTNVAIRGVITGKSDGRFVYVQPCIVAPPQPSMP